MDRPFGGHSAAAASGCLCDGGLDCFDNFLCLPNVQSTLTCSYLSSNIVSLLDFLVAFGVSAAMAPINLPQCECVHFKAVNEILLLAVWKTPRDSTVRYNIEPLPSSDAISLAVRHKLSLPGERVANIAT